MSITRLLVLFFAVALPGIGVVSWATGDPAPVLGFAIAGAFLVPSAALADRMLDVPVNDGEADG